MASHKRRYVAVSEFKAKVRRLIEEVRVSGQEYVVTKHGKPMVLVTPIRAAGGSMFGTWKGTESGNIVQCDWSDEFSATRGRRS